MFLEWLPVIFFFIALIYSSVGFGGGSSYLALLSLAVVDFHVIRSTAHILNIIVVSIGTIFYLRNNHFKLKAIAPFLIFSVPMTYLGALVKLSQTTFFIILGSSLFVAGITMLLRYVKN